MADIAENLIVEIADGRVRGALVEGVAAFKSLPYGASTAGAARFLPPRPPAPWAGVRDATAFATQAPQFRGGPAQRPEMAGFLGAPDPSPESEDCLALNVWTTALPPASPRPVMVWFHGGAFSFGSSNNDTVRGSRLARHGDVVVVTVNQRLNIFGHLDLAARYGTAYALSGNAGALDMLAALRWVRDNIGAFGGDPGCVAIFGESGGGGKVSTLMAMPAAQGLFHRAIIQSGASVRLRTPERAARLTDAVLAHLGLVGAPVEALLALPMEALIAAIAPAEQALGPSPYPLLDRYPFGPTMDGEVVAHHPGSPEGLAISAGIPLMIGDTAQEATLFLTHVDAVWHRTLSEDGLARQVLAMAGARTSEVLETYRRLMPAANPAERLIAAMTDGRFRSRSVLMAEGKAALGAAPAFYYRFAWPSPAHGGRLGAPHAIDVPLTFDTTDLTGVAAGAPAAAGLAGIVAETWAHFTHTGTPGHPAIPAWPAYEPSHRATMVLDVPCRVEENPGAETRALWQEIALG